MAEEKNPIGDMVLVGAVAYQLYSRVYYGNVEYYAEIGRPWTSKQTGRTVIIGQMKAVAARDYVEAANRAATQLEEIRGAQFKHGLAANAQTITPIADEAAQKPLELKLA